MIRVEFCADTVSQLKADILAYAAELSPVKAQVSFGMSMAAEAQKRIDARKSVETKAPIEEALDPAPVKRGRPKKAAQPPPEPEESEVSEEVEELPMPSEAEVQAAVVSVNEKHGFEKAVECLAKFGVKRARELKDDQKAAFVAHCNQVVR
jgi:hypothetical protein